MRSYRIPKVLNRPSKLAKWDSEDLIVCLVLTCMFWLFGSLLVGVAVAGTVLTFVSFLKNNPNGDLTKKLHYWFFPNAKSYKVLPQSHIREWLG